MNDSLNGALQTAASSIDIQPGDLDRVVSRGAGRRRRNKRLGRGATALVLVVSLIASVNAFGSRDDGVPLRVGSGEVLRGDIPIEWSRQETSPLGWVGSIEEVSGTLYTLSTAPGERAVNGQGVVWHSDNGIDWSPRDRPGDLYYLSNLAAAGDRLYAVGTTPATARTTRGKEVGDPVVAWSEDGARTWQRTRLPIDMEDIAAHSSDVSIMEGAEVAASERGVVVVTRIAADPDLSILLPPGTDPSNGWVAGPTGIDILASSAPECPGGSFQSKHAWGREPSGRVSGVPCFVPAEGPNGEAPPTALPEAGPPEATNQWHRAEASPQEVFGVKATYTWDELNVGDDLREALLGKPILSRAEVDGTFRHVQGVMPDDTSDAKIVAAPDGSFVLFVATQSGVNVSTSADGSSWQSAPKLSRFKGIIQTGWVDDRLVLEGWPDSQTNMIGALETDVVAIGLPAEGWQEIDLREIANMQGSPMGEILWANMSSTSSTGIAITIRKVNAGDHPGGIQQLLLSRDGVTWSVISLDEVLGAHVLNVQVAATPRGLVVFADLDSTGDGDPERSVVLMGTYR